MNKTRLVELLSIKTGFTKKEIDHIINLFIDNIISSVQNGDDVEIRGFGTFFQAVQDRRSIKSPIAKKTIEVPAKTKISFKASRITDKEINRGV